MRKILVAAIVAVGLAAVSFIPRASAASGAHIPYSGTTSIPIIRKTTHIGGRVNATFSYSLKAKSGNPAVVTGLQNVNIIANSDSDNDKKEHSARCSIELQNMLFKKVGNYAFTLYESATSDEENFPKSEDKYDIFFQVTNVLDDDGIPTGELSVSLLDEMYSYRTDSKVPLVANFEAPANFTYISLENKVSGVGADTSEYFKYKITIGEGIISGAKLTIAGQDENVSYGGESIATAARYTVGSGDLYVYLKHGQTVTIGKYENGNVTANEIPLGVHYTIERIESEDGYTTKLDGADITTVAKNTSAVSAENFSVNNQTLAINNKDATVNTGVFMASWPFLLISIFGLAGFVIVRRLTRSA